MISRRPPALTLALVTGGAVVSLGGVAALASTSSDVADDPVRVVALGDSYAAGVGTDSLLPPPDADCRRTADSYPRVLGAALSEATGRQVDVDVLACSGATTLSTLTGSDTTTGPDGEPRDIQGPDQLGAVDGDTDVVTLTVGAGDIDFDAILEGCFTDPGGCEDALAAAAAAYDPAVLADLLLEVDAALGDRAEGERPTVLVTGYPAPFDVDAAAAGQCPGVPIVPSAELAAAVNASTDELNSAIAATTSTAAAGAANADIQYVDVDAAFDGQRVCSAEAWLNPPSPTVDQVRWLHPTTEGHAAYAGVLAQALDAGPAPSPSVTEGSTSPTPTESPTVVIPTAVPAGG